MIHLRSAARRPVLYLILLTASLFLFSSLTACGRRGDPVVVEPREKRTVESEKPAVKRTGAEVSREQEEETPSAPDAPEGLKAVYTGRVVVLTWNEVSGKGPLIYTVYRSEGSDYSVVGTTQTPAFSDPSVSQDKTYYYRVSASGAGVGEMSEALKISTGMGEE